MRQRAYLKILEKDLEKLSSVVDRYTADRNLGSVDDVLNVGGTFYHHSAR